MQKIVPFLWFNNQAEEAVNFYLSVFKNGKIISMVRNGPNGPGPEGTVWSAVFELEGITFYALNGGPMFSFTPAISLYIDCQTQEEIDEIWEKMTSDGGKPLSCGWVTDKFNLTWQVVPSQLTKLLQDKDPVRAGRVNEVMMKMEKLIIKDLQDAYDGKIG
ncbi:VOC family protein [Chitinophaga sp. Cy-1792]|uniref:VOC family protein n=1 Tax=Chitinophaga sp. Cy-1792 TaxID=2608339 RepID=UPI00141FAC87|nr:VOC family protein [Chitinophaga sp. Cy-1792]NIG56013.1 VOC family protein [Chitinophaga sp. Cy-1792]